MDSAFVGYEKLSSKAVKYIQKISDRIDIFCEL